MSCNGDGSCLKVCICNCPAQEPCKCKHRSHIFIALEKNSISKMEENLTHGFCQNPCKYGCSLVKCNRFLHCGDMFPQWYINLHDGDLHKEPLNIEYLEKVRRCIECNKIRYMIKTNLGRICFDCLLETTN